MIDNSLIVHINGWPGSGKLTIARILAPRLAARLVDNHALLNPAEMLFERGDPLRESLRRAIRDAAFDHARRLPAGTGLVFTDALSTEAADQALFADYVALAAARNARLAPVVLDISAEENARRIASPGRERLKLTSPAVLASLRAKHELLTPAGAIRLDVTALSPEAAATAIERALASARG